jgi:hypothetical protein
MGLEIRRSCVRVRESHASFFLGIDTDSRFQLATAQQPSFEFLDENHIVFAGANEGQLCVYNIQDFPPLRTKPSALEEVRCCQVTYPPCGREGFPKRIYFKHNTLNTSASDGGPFCMDPAQRLLVVLVTTPATQGGERGVETVELYLSASALLSCVQPIRVPAVGQVAHPRTPDMARVLRVTAPHFVTPSAVRPSRFSVCGMRAVFSRPTWHKGQLVLRVADYHAGRVVRSHDHLTAAPGKASGLYFADDATEPGRGRRDRRIGQSGAGLVLEERSVSRTGRAVSVNTARPMQQYFERSVPLPWSMQVDNGLSVSSVLCEDSILFFQVSYVDPR